MKIFIGGDFCPENSAEKELINGNNLIDETLKPIWDSCDYRILNLEGPITSSNLKINKIGRHIKFSPEVINGIIEMKVDVFSLSNNHIMDYGEKGIIETIELLESVGINHFGNHKNKYLLLEKDSVKVAIVSFTNNEFSLLQDYNGSGVYGMDVLEIINTLEEIKQITDNIIVILHTGLSKFPYPSPQQRKICNFLVQRGARAILCQHSHIIGAYETLDNSLISYGQGSFIFDLKRQNSFWNKGYSILFDIKEEGFTYKIIGHKQFDDVKKVRLLNKDEILEFNSEIENINNILNSSIDWQNKWELYLKKNEKYYYNQFFLPKNRLIRKFFNKINFANFISKQTKLLMLNNLKNDEHREVLIDLLKKNIKG